MDGTWEYHPDLGNPDTKRICMVCTHSQVDISCKIQDTCATFHRLKEAQKGCLNLTQSVNKRVIEGNWREGTGWESRWVGDGVSQDHVCGGTGNMTSGAWEWVKICRWWVGCMEGIVQTCQRSDTRGGPPNQWGKLIWVSQQWGYGSWKGHLL